MYMYIDIYMCILSSPWATPTPTCKLSTSRRNNRLHSKFRFDDELEVPRGSTRGVHELGSTSLGHRVRISHPTYYSSGSRARVHVWATNFKVHNRHTWEGTMKKPTDKPPMGYQWKSGPAQSPKRIAAPASEATRRQPCFPQLDSITLLSLCWYHLVSGQCCEL